MSLKLSEIASLIRNKWSCVDYCRDVLNLPIYRSGDRCATPLLSGEHSETGFWVFDSHWIDWSQGGIGGDVIDLAAFARYNGDRAQAFQELGAEFYCGASASSWKAYTSAMTRTVNRWHECLMSNPQLQDVGGVTFSILDYLHDRGITDDTIKRLKLGLCLDANSGMYYRLITPYYKNGQAVYYSGRDMSGRWRTEKAKCPKYKKKFTKANENSENIPWGMDTIAPFGDCWIETSRGKLNKDKYLVIGEGQFDIMSFYQEGWHVLSSIGGHFPKTQMPMIADICRKFERVFICFDSDGPGVAFQHKMAKFLFGSRVKFVCGHLPEFIGAAKIKDVSDYYALGGSLDELVATATEGILDLARSFTEGSEDEFKEFVMSAGRFVDKPDLARLQTAASAPTPDMLEGLSDEEKDTLIAQSGHLDSEFVRECVKEAKKPPVEKKIVDEIIAQHNMIFSVNDGFYEYSHGLWSRLPEQAVQYYARERLGDFAVSGRMRSIARHIQAVKWTQEAFNSKHIINFPNGIHNLETDEFVPHSDSYMSTIQLPYCYDPKATCGMWEDFIASITNGNAGLARALGQAAGYVLFPDCSLETGFFLIGNGANGKSVYINVLRQVFGTKNCSSVEPSKMGDSFEPLALRHSLVNFATETRLNIHENESGIKKIISGETIRAAHKGVDAVEFRPRAKFFCACNNFLQSKDITYGFMRRFLFIPFMRTFKRGEADTELTSKLLKYLPGIYNWCVKYYHELRRDMKFYEPPEHLATLNEYMAVANPISGFIDERYMDVWNATLNISRDIYSFDYIQWCKDAGCQAMNKFNFTKQFKTVMHQKRPEVTFTNGGGSGTVVIFPDKPKATLEDTVNEWRNL